MSKNLIFAQKMTKLWACQISQNKKKHPVVTMNYISWGGMGAQNKYRTFLRVVKIFLFSQENRLSLPRKRFSGRRTLWQLNQDIITSFGDLWVNLKIFTKFSMKKGKLPGLVVNIEDSQSEPWSLDVSLIPGFA